MSEKSTEMCDCGNPAKVDVEGVGKKCWYCYRKLRKLSLDETYRPKDEIWGKEKE